MALFANSLRCNGASAAEGRPSVAQLASSRQPVTQAEFAAEGLDQRAILSLALALAERHWRDWRPLAPGVCLRGDGKTRIFALVEKPFG